ncbi:MAG: hypothetical protein HYS12_15300 [Planctomycetes bacterium]|nr:hypothetical protein [Planctomycetota bacterium]
MRTVRLLSLGALALLLSCAARARGDELPVSAKRIIEETDRAIQEIEKKTEAAVKKAEEDIKQKKKQLLERLEALEAGLTKEAKFAQAKAVRERIQDLKAGPIVAQPDPGSPGGLRGQNGKVFHFEVTGANAGTVWGTDIYTDDSPIAMAAVHAGVLKVGEKAVVKVTILPGQGSYSGSMRNGISTSDYGPWQGSYKVEPARRKR